MENVLFLPQQMLQVPAHALDGLEASQPGFERNPSPYRPLGRWAHLQAVLGVIHVVLGGAIVAWATQQIGFHTSAYMLGVMVVVLGGIGLVGSHKSMRRAKLLYAVSATLAAVLAVNFYMQTTQHVQQSCFNAEMSLKIAHLEDALVSLRHDDMLSAMTWRMDMLHTMLEHVEQNAEDFVEVHTAQRKFKQQDEDYVQVKLSELVRLADKAQAHLDDTWWELKRNITTVEAATADGSADPSDTSDPATSELLKSQLAGRLAGLRARETWLARQRDVIQDVVARLARHVRQETAFTAEDYKDIVGLLQKSASRLVIADDLNAEVQHADYVQAAIKRLEEDKYADIPHARLSGRMQVRKEHRDYMRKEYQTHLDNIMSGHKNAFTSRETYLKSLSERNQDLPDLCMRGIDSLNTGSVLAVLLIATAGVGAYASLSSVVLSEKKFS